MDQNIDNNKLDIINQTDFHIMVNNTLQTRSHNL